MGLTISKNIEADYILEEIIIIAEPIKYTYSIPIWHKTFLRRERNETHGI